MHGAMTFAFVALTALLPPRFQAQEKPLSPQARRLTDALTKLEENSDDSSVQEQYLKAFPHTYRDFLGLFDYHRELYDGYDFTSVLPSLAKYHETEVGNLLTQLSKDAQKEADAPSHLQHATAAYASRYTRTFALLLNRLPEKERMHLIVFLADVENFSAYPDYQTTIDHLKSLGQNRLAKEFEAARKKRSQQPQG